MDKRNVGWSLVGIGVVLLLLGLTADVIGVGEGNAVGYKQIAAMVVGALLAGAGSVRARG